MLAPTEKPLKRRRDSTHQISCTSLSFFAIDSVRMTSNSEATALSKSWRRSGHEFEPAGNRRPSGAVEATAAWHSHRQRQFTADSFFVDSDHSITKIVQ
jgi:hypothetical protein